MNSIGKCIPQKDVSWNVKDRVCSGTGLQLAEKISTFFEAKLMNAFHEIHEYLRHFTVQTPKTYDHTLNLHKALGKYKPSMGMHSLVYDPRPKDTPTTPETEPMEIDFQTKDYLALVNDVAKMLRCHFESVLQMKYKVKSWIINDVLLEARFEDMVKKSLTPETHKYLQAEVTNANILKDRGEMRKVNSSTYLVIFNRIRYDIRDLIDEIDKTMRITEKNVFTMQKMMIEIEGNVTHSIVPGVKEFFQPCQPAPKVSNALREDLLEYAFIILYDFILFLRNNLLYE